jgi:hypothetical protein
MKLSGTQERPLQEDLREIDGEIGGKLLSKMQIKDIACSQNNMLLAIGKKSPNLLVQ